MKPYRLINSFELTQLSNQFKNTMKEWNQEYSLHPINLELSLPDKEEAVHSIWSVTDDSFQPIALLNHTIHKLMNYSLFGEQSHAFNSVSEELFLLLLNQLLSCDDCSLKKGYQETPHWIYPGSTCLVLRINCGDLELTILLNPEWVYQALPAAKKIMQPLRALEEVVVHESLRLEATLNPVAIQVKQLMELQVGDVLVTDHELYRPLSLIRQQQEFAQVELGQALNNKSILIKEFV